MDKSIPKDDTSLTSFWSSILGFTNHYQYVDTRDLVSNYLLICWSNGWALLIKVVQHDEISKLHFWPKVQFGPEVVRISIPPRLLWCPPRPRWYACVAAMHQCAPSPLLPRGSAVPVPMGRGYGTWVLPTPPSSSPSRTLPPSSARHRHGRAGARATTAATGAAPSPPPLLHAQWLHTSLLVNAQLRCGHLRWWRRLTSRVRQSSWFATSGSNRVNLRMRTTDSYE